MNKELEKLVENKKRSSITDLNKVTESLIEEARKLASPIIREMFFSYLFIPSDQRYVRQFIMDCVEENTPPQEWMRGRILIPSVSLEHQLTKKRAEILSGINDQPTHYLPVDYEAWKQGSYFSGAPVKLEPESTYRSSMPEGMVSTSIEDVVPAVGKNTIAMHRRWIAQRIARCIDMNHGNITAQEIMVKTSAFTPEDKWIEDARFAINGLAAEVEQGLIKDGLVPGFILSDEFYL